MKLVLLDTESNVIGTVVDSQRVESLPLNGRDFLQLALITAGSESATGRADGTGQIGHPDRGCSHRRPARRIDRLHGERNRHPRRPTRRIRAQSLHRRYRPVQSAAEFFHAGPGAESQPGERNHQGWRRISFTARFSNTSATAAWTPETFSPLRRRSSSAISSEAPSEAPSSGTGSGSSPIMKGCARSAPLPRTPTLPLAPCSAATSARIPQPIYDPATYSAAAGTRMPFPNNLIPADRIDAVSRNLLKYYLPGASVSQRPSNLFASPKNTLNDDQFGGRIDASLDAESEHLRAGHP